MSEQKDERSSKVPAAGGTGSTRETQAYLAFLVTGGFLGIAAFAVAKATTFDQIVAVLTAVSPLAYTIAAYYFAHKAAKDVVQAAAATASK